MRLTLTLYGRAGCHLCEDMRAQLYPLEQRYGFSVELIDIGGDPELGARYGLKIPVLTAGAEEICHYTLDADALIRYLNDHNAN